MTISRPVDPAVGARAALPEITVVPMHKRHLRGVLTIEQLVYPRPWSPGLFASELGQPDTRRYFVALAPRAGLLGRRRMVVGYAGVMIVAGEAHITTVATHPEHHRRKVASRLLVRMLREVRDSGAGAATLEVRSANRGAQRLYGAFGFAPVGVRPGYYAETGEDAVIMWAYDVQSDEFVQRLERQEQRLDRPGGDSGAPDHHVPWVRGRVGLQTAGDEAGGR